MTFEHRWQPMLRGCAQPLIGGDETVGAGLGSNVGLLIAPLVREWVCLEPDASLAEQIRVGIIEGRLPEVCRVQVGTIATIGSTELFDTILYIDVLEHIDDDSGEVRRAAHRLADNGYLVILAPAYQALFSAFDASVGHFRRYSRRQLEALAPPGMRQVGYRMLDSCGLLASLANRLLLHQSEPSHAQITFWNDWLVRLSRVIDPLTRYSFGKTIVMVWHRSDPRRPPIALNS